MLIGTKKYKKNNIKIKKKKYPSKFVCRTKDTGYQNLKRTWC